MRTGPNSIDDYIVLFPTEIQELLMQVRKAIAEAAPQATEAIKYAMPTFVLGKNLVHFAAFKNHIGFYPAPSGIAFFSDELKPYETSKGAIRFPYTKPLPLDLIKKITAFRVSENMAGLKPGEAAGRCGFTQKPI